MNGQRTILRSSKGTFEWYLDNLQRLGFYNIGREDFDKLHKAINDIHGIIEKLEVIEEDEE